MPKGINRLFFILTLCLLSTAGLHSQSDPTEETIHQRYLRALDLISAFQFERAQEILSACYHEDPENVDYLARIAYCNFQLGRYRDAKIFYNKILQLDSLNTIAISSLGSIYERESNLVEAQRYYLKLLSIDTTNSYYYKRNAYLALQLRDPIRAIGNFLIAHRLNESDLEVIDQLSSIYLALDQTDYAEQILEKGLRLDGKNIALLYNKARLHNRRQQYPQVVEAIEAAMMQGDTSDYYQMVLGVAYVRIDSLDRAIQHLEAIVARKKDTEHTHHYLGLAYFGKGDYTKSEEHLQLAIKKGISEKMGTYHGDLANVLAARNDLRGAIDHYRQALEYATDAEFLFRLAQLSDQYYKDKKIALQYFEQYLASGHGKFRDYSEQRSRQLREYLHFQQ